MEFDYIIVGGGSAGCVMASRLSEKDANRVLLIEAGPDTPPARIPSEIASSYPGRAYLNARYVWNDLKVRVTPVPHNAPETARPMRKYEQARVLGGGSSINGQLANRGAPADYDEWVERGAAGWGWADVLPYFRKLEHDTDFDGPMHGKGGPIMVSRIMPDKWSAYSKAVAAAFAGTGSNFYLDQNEAFREGHYPLVISNVHEHRVSAAMGYLNAGVRARPNLRILTEAQVTKLEFENQRCVGVRALVDGVEQTFRAGEIILSAGAIHTPAILQRAGIGPAGHLRARGIEVLADVPAVGSGLMDHPVVALASFLKREARMSEVTGRHMQVSMRYSSGLDGSRPGDMVISALGKSAWHDVGRQIGSLVVILHKTLSQNGTVRLASPDWRDEPVVDFNLLSDRRDLVRLMDGLRRAAAIQLSEPVKAVTSNPFPTSYSDRMRKAGAVNRWNGMRMAIVSRLLDANPMLRNFLMRNFIVEGYTLEELLGDEEKLEDFIRSHAVGAWHAACTCRMGRADDPAAAVDNEGRVKGVEGLRVVDASIFPVIPCANTNVPTIMAAEKIAATMLRA